MYTQPRISPCLLLFFIPGLANGSPVIPGLSPGPATKALTPISVWDLKNLFRLLQSPCFIVSQQDEIWCSLLLHRKKIQLLGSVLWEKYVTCAFLVVQLLVTFCYMEVKWSGLNILLKYGQKWKITMWFETVSGEHLLQFMEKVWSEDLTTC